MTEIITAPRIYTGRTAIISMAEWMQVPDNPRQRNTPQHSKWATGQHLKKYSESQEFVAMACMDGKPLCKIDGHSRTYLWKTHGLELPPDGKVVVSLYHVDSIEKAKELYDHYDSAGAVKKPKDLLFSAIGEQGFHLESALLRPCRFSWQLKILDRMSRRVVPLSTTVQTWKKELIDLDELALSDKYKILIGFMLIAIKFQGIEKAGRFLADLDKGRGTRSPLGQDGINAVRETIKERRLKNLVNKEIHRKETWEIAWTGFVKWLDGKLIKNDYRIIPNRGIWDVIRPKLETATSNGKADEFTELIKEDSED